MKRFFTSLKSVVCVALVACMMGTSVVSCSYDDTDLKNEIAQIQKDLAALKERVADLEKKLQDEVAALKGLVDGKLLVTGVETVGGNTVVTLSDGSTFTIYAPIEDTDTDTDTYLSVKEDGGVYYWAVFNKEGFVDWLFVDGEKVAVVAEAGEGCDCVPAELKFMVDEQSGNLLVSIDGGNTWVDSGIAAEGVAADGSCVFAGAVANEDGTVTFTLADGSTFTVAIAEPIEFNVKGSLYVKAGETKEVTFEAGEAVSDVEVMNQPMGWKASVSENVLSITAPKSELIALGAAEKNGTVALHVNTASGACKVAKLNVNFAELTAEIVDGNLVVKNSLVSTYEYYDNWEWAYVETTDFDTWTLFMMPYDAFKNWNGTLEEYLMDWNTDSWSCNDENLANAIENVVYDRQSYQEGVFEQRVFTASIEDIVNGLAYGNVPFEGESFMFAIIPHDMQDPYFAEIIDKAILVEFKQLAVKVEVLEETFNGAKFDVTLRGGIEYHLQYLEAKNIDQNIEWGYTAEEYYQTNFYNWINYGMDWGQHVIREDIAGEFTLDEFMNYKSSYGVMNTALAPDTEYEFSILPIEEGREKESYGYSDLYIFRFKTAALVEATEPMDITVEAVADFSSITATVTVPETAVAVYSAWYDNEFVMGSEELNNHISASWCKSDFSEGYTYELNNSGLSTGQTKYLVLVAVDAEGNYTFVQKAITTLVPVTNTEYTLGVGEYSIANDIFTVELTGIDGAEVVKYRYYMVNVDYWQTKSNETLQSELAVSSNWLYLTLEGENVTNPVQITSGLKSYSYQNLIAGTTYKFAIIAQFADGSFSNVVIIDEVEYALNVIAEDDEKWAATKPELIDLLCVYSTYGYWEVSYNFTTAEGITVYTRMTDPETINSYPIAKQKVAWLVDNTLSYWDGCYSSYANTQDYDLWYCWSDAEGNYYAPVCYDLEPDLLAAQGE